MKKKTAGILALLLTLGCLAGCGQSKSSTVSTDGSTSMSKVIGALGEAFQQETGTKVTYNPTGSGSGIQAVQAFLDYVISGRANEIISAAGAVPAC